MTEITEYQVARAFWFAEDVFENEHYACRPSKELDSRMIEGKTFKTKEEALEYAERDFGNRKGDLDWLAYYVVYEVKKTVIKELKDAQNITAPIYKW